jgi:hypothetical protein
MPIPTWALLLLKLVSMIVQLTPPIVRLVNDLVAKAAEPAKQQTIYLSLAAAPKFWLENVYVDCAAVFTAVCKNETTAGGTPPPPPPLLRLLCAALIRGTPDETTATA